MKTAKEGQAITTQLDFAINQYKIEVKIKAIVNWLDLKRMLSVLRKSLINLIFKSLYF